MKNIAIVLAAGNGSRMKSDIRKQFIDICGKPIIYYSLYAFQQSNIDEIIIVTNVESVNICKKIVEKYQLSKVVNIVEGGSERYESVYNGLQSITKANYVLIHDGARPFIEVEQINEMLDKVALYKACVAGVVTKDTIKISDEDGNVETTPDRQRVWQVQTPQAFSYNLVKDAYDLMMSGQPTGITDDAMVVEEYARHKVKLVTCSYNNIKITTPEDLVIGEAICKSQFICR